MSIPTLFTKPSEMPVEIQSAGRLESTKKFLKAADIRTAILSVTTPGPTIETDSGAAALLAQNCNEFSAKLRSDDPSTFGFFASLPSLLDKEVTLKELERAFDVLGADGVTLYTRYGSGQLPRYEQDLPRGAVVSTV